MRTTSSAPAACAALALALAGALTACTPGPAADPTPSPSVAPSETPSETPTPEPTETPEPDDTEALPPGFPDPETLIGQDATDVQTADGSWRTVVGGTELELVLTFGACFDGGSGDICGYSISGSVPPAAGGVVQPAEVGLLLLLQSTGALADGTPTWVVLDALIAHAPSGGPEYFQTCEGAPGVAIYSDPAAPLAATIPASAAWGPDAAVTSLITVAPASLSCEAMGP